MQGIFSIGTRIFSCKCPTVNSNDFDFGYWQELNVSSRQQ